MSAYAGLWRRPGRAAAYASGTAEWHRRNVPGRRTLAAAAWAAFAASVSRSGWSAALGPLPLGLAYDYLGGYDAAIAGMLVLPVIAAIAIPRAASPSAQSRG